MSVVVKAVVRTSDVAVGTMADTPALDMGFNARRLRANLARNSTAMEALARLGIERALIERVGLGIKEPYVTASGIEVGGVLTYPLDAECGRRRYGYLNLCGVTVNPDHAVAWSPGSARPVGFGKRGVLVVAASPMTMLRARATIERRRLAVSVVASSQPDRLPRDWLDPAYWAPWERVVLDEALPATIKATLAQTAARPVEMAAGVAIEPASTSSPSAVLDEWLDDMLAVARPFVVQGSECDSLGFDVGDFAAVPISLHGGYTDGQMYYPFMIERRRKSDGGALLCSYETLVVRSDGSVLEARVLPAPAGTPSSGRVHCLTDGTRIASAPEPSRNGTWSFEAIQAYVADRACGRDPVARGTARLMDDVHGFLSSRVCLPDPDDLWLATVFVALTHMFRAFPSIPLLLVEGPRGSGKSELASAIASLAFNAVTMGQGSAASLVRVAQECGGLVVLDDVEGLSAGGLGFGELSQCLKVGYRASTARKPITLGSGRIETFDFFGPRLLTCTRGVEPILRSRCITIPMVASRVASPVADVDPETLRDELHALGMARVCDVVDAFRLLSDDAEGRADEIWAPLLAIAETMGPPELVAAVGRARASHPD